MARNSHRNFANTGFRSRNNTKVHFTRSTEGTDDDTNVASESGADPLDFLSAVPLEQPPVSFLGLDPFDWRTFFRFVFTLVAFAGAWSWGSAYGGIKVLEVDRDISACNKWTIIRNNSDFVACAFNSPRYHLPFTAYGYNESHFSFMANSSAEILGFPPDFVERNEDKVEHDLVSTKVPDSEKRYITLAKLYEPTLDNITMREKELEDLWSARPADEVGLTESQLDWILKRYRQARKDLRKEVLRKKARRFRFWESKSGAADDELDEFDRRDDPTQSAEKSGIKEGTKTTRVLA